MKTIFSSTSILQAFGLVCALLLASCSPGDGFVNLDKKEGNGDATPKTQATTSAAVDYDKMCGVDTSSTDENAILFQQQLKSLPIVVEGEQMGAKFRVTTSALLKIASKQSGGTVDVSVTVENVEVTASNPIVGIIAPAVAKGKAADQAKKASGPKNSEGVPLAEWMNLVTSNPEFKDLFCGVQATKKVTDTAGEKTGVVEFIPGLPNNINPRAPRETLEKEIGDGRSFRVVAKVITTKDNWPAVGETAGSVTIKPRESSFKMSDGKTYASDIAYDVTVDYPVTAGAKIKPSFATHQLFFINTKTHDFDAIVDLSVPVMEDGTKVPPKVLLRQ